MLTALVTPQRESTRRKLLAEVTTVQRPAGYHILSGCDPSSLAIGRERPSWKHRADHRYAIPLAGFARRASGRGLLNGLPEERAWARRSGEALVSSSDGRIALAARIGTVEAQIEDASSRNSAEATALGILRSANGSVDPYEAATRLENARAQLESLYLVTARVSRLSLVEFLS